MGRHWRIRVPPLTSREGFSFSAVSSVFGTELRGRRSNAFEGLLKLATHGGGGDFISNVAFSVLKLGNPPALFSVNVSP